ncbi:MAG: hypothetical protein QOF25_3210 [Mycobacterium sp.]|nr:hypothetical protein [Mycobacterium sp.]
MRSPSPEPDARETQIRIIPAASAERRVVAGAAGCARRGLTDTREQRGRHQRCAARAAGKPGQVGDSPRCRSHPFGGEPGPEVHERVGAEQPSIQREQADLGVPHAQPLHPPPADRDFRVVAHQVPHTALEEQEHQHDLHHHDADPVERSCHGSRPPRHGPRSGIRPPRCSASGTGPPSSDPRRSRPRHSSTRSHPGFIGGDAGPG